MRHTEPVIVVTLSREGLRCAYGDNAALLKSARLHEIAAAALSLAGVVLFVAWGVDLIARRTDMHPLVAGILIWAVVAALFIGFMVGAGEQERRRK